MAETVRELVREIQVEVRETHPTPTRASELLGKLTALIGNCNEVIRSADAAYAAVLLEHLETSKHASIARIKAETTEQYRWKREARDTKELVIELIRALKYQLRAAEEELRLTR